MKREDRIKLKRITYYVGYIVAIVYRLVAIFKNFRKGD